MADFFDTPQGAAVLKHRLLQSYLSVFTGKLGSQAPDRRVVFIDGYAGPGQYLDESPGSPMLAVETARRLATVRQLECRFIESNREYYEALCTTLRSDDTYAGWDAVLGSAQDHLDQLVAGAGLAPLLVFLDPYGLTVPFDQLVNTILNRPSRAGGTSAVRPTEVIFNFSLSAVRRFAGWLDRTYEDPKTQRQQVAILSKLDEFFGGQWWRAIRRQGGDDWIRRVLSGYLTRLTDASGTGWGYCVASASDRYLGPPSYYLVLMTQHADGLWHFNEGASLGLDALRERSLGGQQEIDPSGRKQELVDAIVENIRRSLAAAGPFTINQRVAKVYGDTLGQARGLHVRAALYILFKAGDIDRSPRGVKDPGRFRVEAPR